VVRRRFLAAGLVLVFLPVPGRCDNPPAAALPAGVKTAWDLGKAWRQATPTREKISINGLWRWQPAANDSGTVPTASWGWFKVPGGWPGLRDYMMKESQTLHPHPAWKDADIGGLSAAWYQREIAIPAEWEGRRIALAIETLNSYAAVYVDGVKAGEITFPGGELELPSVCAPGTAHVLSLLVIGMPLKAVMLSYSDSARAKEVKGEVERRGLCGDVWLVSTPAGPRVTDFRIETSVRRGEITFDAGLDGLDPADSYRMVVRVTAGGKKLKSFAGRGFGAADVKGGRQSFTVPWKTDRIWDTDAPANQLDAELVLETTRGRRLDAAFPVRFGFREFWIDVRDYILNGSRVHVSAVPVDNCAISALAAGYAGCRETFERLKAAGYNAVYTHNYGTDPGTHLAFPEMLRAADDTGMLVFFSMPHFGNYDWDKPDSDAANGYARHAAAYVRVAQNHPSVVLYVTSHNGCGYDEDMNPDLLGNGHPPRGGEWSERGARRALRAEGIIRSVDPSRVVYHHSAGDLGAMDTVNFYGNQMPAAEMAEFLEPWSRNGIKPVFLCEFGAPLTWDWTMYRGWYKGEREFGSGEVPWEYCVAEWNSQYLGDAGYRIEEVEKRDIRWEAEQFRTSKGWHRWDYPVEVGSPRNTNWHPIFGRVLTAQLRGLRTSGLSGICLWDDELYWRVRDDIDRSRKELPTDWEKLQRPGFSADFTDGERYESWRVSYERSDWTPSVAGRAIIRNNRPLLAWIAGSASGFTSAEHDYAPGETVQKQLVVINDSRRQISCEYAWACALPSPATGAAKVTIGPGDQVRIPVTVPLPATLAEGRYSLSATVAFSTGETQTDALVLDVLAPPASPVAPADRVGIFDPAGETTALLHGLGVEATGVEPGADLRGVGLLVIGRRALTPDGPGPDLTRVREGLKVVVFEQTAAALEKRLGFRTVEYGFRNVWRRVPDHPALAGLDENVLHDWRGEATLIPPRLDYEMVGMHGPTIRWCGIPVSRMWRCGCRGNVASVSIEKPARGDFLPVLDCGFSLQYSPLLEYREGKGMVIFCQVDVTGRTAADPAAARLVRNIIGYVSRWTPAPRRTIRYAGDPSGSRWLGSAGFAARRYAGGKLNPDEVLVVGPGAGSAVPPGGWLGAGGRMVAVGLDWKQANAVFPPGVRMKAAEHINAVFDPPAADSPLAGVGPADVHVRDARTVSLVDQGPLPVGDGVLATSFDGRVVFDQLAPWQFAPGDGLGLRRTYRRVSFLLSRLLANQGVSSSTPLLERFRSPAGPKETRYLSGLYVDTPIEWDDPYRFFRW